VKTHPSLPDLDLARIAPLPRDQKRRQLEGMRLGRPPYSYNPMRKYILDILNIAAGPLGLTSRAPWASIAWKIQRDSRGENEELANLTVGSSLYNFATKRKLSGQRHDIYPLSLGVSEKVTYWSPAVVAFEDERPFIPFIDPRRNTKRLTPIARRFVFSVMNERCAVDPDLADVSFCIVQFTSSSSGTRTPALYYPDGLELFDFTQLDEMVRETYEMWYEILDERTLSRRKSGLGSGSLL